MFSRLVVKLYDKDLVYKKNIPFTQLGSDISFTSAINTGFGQLTLRYQKEVDDTTFEHWDIVKVYDTSQNVVNTVPSWGSYYYTQDDVAIYAGQVVTVNRIITGRDEYLDIECLGIQTLLYRLLYEYSASTSFTRTTDPSTMVKEILDLFPGYFSYTVGTIPNYGSNLSIEFDNIDCYTAIQNIIDATGWIMRFGADWVVYFNERDSTPTEDHTIVFGKHIIELQQREESSELINKVKVEWSSWTAGWINDATSQTAYWIRQKYITNTSLKDSTTATAHGTAYVALYKDPKLNTRIVINDSYDIGTVQAWQVVKVVGDPTVVGSKYVEKLDYSPDKLIVYLDSFESAEKSLSRI